MATESFNVSEDTEMTDCDGEKVVTMMDVLQEQEDFEEDVNAVLGASDEKDCTYAKGYIKRQAIYACMTCCSNAKNDPTKRAGVCLACSLTCHENHELIELYTKRNFQCDCGNSKFNSHPCQFTQNKTELNEENNYNQNFSGLYCICQRPYPDPECTIEVEMIQCIICEDWLHASHLEATVPDNDQYSEMICKGCMEKNDFLHDYGNFAVNCDVDIVTNGIDGDNLCNGDANLSSSIKDDSGNVTDVKMTENASDDITNNPEENSVEKNSDDNYKNRKNKPEAMESFHEKGDEEKAVDIPMENEEPKELEPEPPVVENVSKDSVIDECIKDSTAEGAIKTETNNREPQNENKETATDAQQNQSAAELKSVVSVEKSTEQLEEEILLADPDDDSKKANAEEQSDTKENESKHPNTELPLTDDNKIRDTIVNKTKNENVTDVDKKLDSEDKLNVLKNNECSPDTVSEKQIDETVPSANEKLVTGDEIKNNLEKSTFKIEKENDPYKEIVMQNGDIGAKISEKRKLSTETETEDNADSSIKKAKLGETYESCVRPKGIQKVHKGATFWPAIFRQKLCTCRECITMYKDLSVLFLIDPEDTVTAYENLGKQKIGGKPATQYEKGLQALSSLDRIQQINALTEYNKMRDKLLDFLKSFKDRREVVKEEDIKAFFAGMKPKREPDGVYFCR